MLTRSQMFYRVVQVGSSSDNINTYHAELQGMHSLLIALKLFCHQHNIQSGRINIVCNNKGILQQTQSFNEYVPCSNSHANLVWAITALRLWSKLSLTFMYIPSHQDAFNQFNDLPPLACLNVWAEHLAKQEPHWLAQLPSHPTPSDILMGEIWMASITGTKIMSDPWTPILTL